MYKFKTTSCGEHHMSSFCTVILLSSQQISSHYRKRPFSGPQKLYTNYSSTYSGQSQISLFWPIHELPTPLTIQSRIRQLVWEPDISRHSILRDSLLFRNRPEVIVVWHWGVTVVWHRGVTVVWHRGVTVVWHRSNCRLTQRNNCHLTPRSNCRLTPRSNCRLTQE